ncbi:hypothetical protein A2996_00205 [Candidatus Campbellbacteria bacterium RIFCSPLOWO2_01_FULL_34_15]|uniref:Uncharacterized protein n=1 Tax=Candidatus Campbellbacteria bacterium RIFCSPLOWO2_01_FULL_34_15 TaxID=1797579 RepID=A0A1F5ENW0_9BACT|nr:MAG: hypothetical protein A2996_00205 [Candidatus Campbellbacteria bacterium RIFCSPLOWO2_01_FULL_34_15]
MEILEKIKNLPIVKILGIGILGLIFLSVAVWFFSFAFRTAFYGGNNMISPSSAPSYDMGYDMMYEEDGVAMKELSMRNVIINQGTIGSDAEEFEVTEYYGNIKTGNLDKTCGRIEELKGFDYVIFENSNRDDRNCSYTFKVKNENAEEVLATVKDLKPENLNANTTTIKNVVDDYTSEVEILEKKLTSLEKTLTDAQSAYDDITVLATRTQDVASLAKIIDSKIQLIERLTTERINIKEQIDRLNRAKADQLDKIDYTYFRLNVSEIIIFDGKALKDSWIYEVRQFINEFNRMLQDISVNLASYLLMLIKIAIYLLIALLVAKYGWIAVKKLWKM